MVKTVISSRQEAHMNIHGKNYIAVLKTQYLSIRQYCLHKEFCMSLHSVDDPCECHKKHYQ